MIEQPLDKGIAMQPNETLAINLQKYFKANDITAHALGKAGTIPQKRAWACLTGTIAPSVNTVFNVCDAVHLDASILTRQEYATEQIRHSQRVGRIADDLMLLSFEEIRFVADMVKGVVSRGHSS